MKSASQSSLQHPGESHAQMLVDGFKQEMNNIMYPNMMTCTATELQDNPWWILDLDETYNIQNVSSKMEKVYLISSRIKVWYVTGETQM